MFGSFLPSLWSSSNRSLLEFKEPTSLCNHSHFAATHGQSQIDTSRRLSYSGKSKINRGVIDGSRYACKAQEEDEICFEEYPAGGAPSCNQPYEPHARADGDPAYARGHRRGRYRCGREAGRLDIF